MKVVPFVVTYNGIATGPALKWCVEYLMEGAPAFGAAVERVDLYAHCQTRAPVIEGLGAMASRFQYRLTTLPFIRFFRKRRLLEVAFASQWLYSEAVLGSAVVELPPDEFGRLCREFAAALSLVRRQVKRSDAFDAAALEEHLQGRLRPLP